MTMYIPPVATGGDSPLPRAPMAITLEYPSIVVKPRSHDRSTRSPLEHDPAAAVCNEPG